MKGRKLFNQGTYRFLLVCLFMMVFSILPAQKPVDFSGKWVMDLTKSDANYGKFYSAMTCVIKQNPQAITIERISVLKDGKQSIQEPVVYTLDGKETAKEQYGGTDKYSAGWSDDMKRLTLKMVRTVNGSDYGSLESYSFSSDGNVLNVNITDLEGGSGIVEVFYRK